MHRVQELVGGAEIYIYLNANISYFCNNQNWFSHPETRVHMKCFTLILERTNFGQNFVKKVIQNLLALYHDLSL